MCESTAEQKPPHDERTLKLGKTIRILQSRLPTLLQTPLPPEILSPQITLHLFPSTHPHLPTVSGRVAYHAALWTAPVAWGRVPIVDNVKLNILSERMVKNGSSSLGAASRAEKLVVRWRTQGKTRGKGMGAFYRGIGANERVDKITEFLGGDARDDEEFTGLFVFEFDEEGRIVSHIIEHVEEGGHWDKMRVVTVTDWLLGKFGGDKEKEIPGLAMPCCNEIRASKSHDDRTAAPVDADSVRKQASSDGRFHRQNSQFRSYVSKDPSAEFPAEKDRYVLYLNYGCPWAHRTNIVRSLKGLESIIQMVAMDFILTTEGWLYTGNGGTAAQDPLHGFKKHKDLYLKADPSYKGRYTVPVLWDKKKETIVSNESSEIIRMFFTEFDDLLAPELREENRPAGGFLPSHLLADIDAINEWIYDTVNNGVYKCGFASTQEAYEENVHPLFQSLDRLEARLGGLDHSPYLFGAHITEADIRLFPTLIRFDAAYHTLFKCNLRMIRYDYPNLHAWLRRLYWDDGPETKWGAFRTTTYFDHIKKGYAAILNPSIVPVGPVPHILPLPSV
ncbi:MAG: hypothetical protein M1838_000043 [Thelocarpon superellum]|nr:MAG: hypothetical protein M1838_000043 [Thelocarpon superellum]